MGEKTKILVSKIYKIKITIVETELEALLLESYYIKKYNPYYNIRLTDSKSYIRVKITLSDRYPKILLARHEDTSGSIFFGPFPSSQSVKLVLKTIRRVFPYQSVLNHPKRICLYYHLGLCPCPPVFDSKELQKTYKKNIRNIIRIFKGQSKTLMNELESKRDEESKHENFEAALVLQKKINALSLITSPHHKPFEYDINPNLHDDLRRFELQELRLVLQNHGLNVKKLDRIECYDISNTQGTRATGSMVVFVHGEKDSSQYRKFKIRISGKPNDFAMMKEVLTRRIKHEDWHMPDLIILDGGKGQLSSVLTIFKQYDIHIPFIGLAKREETIVVIQNDEFKEISLPHNSPSLKLLMRIRDEAHRFAITYHKLLRSKQAFL